MLVSGARDTGYPPEPMGREIHESIPGSRWEILDSAHFIPTERPKELTALIRDFLVEK